MRRTPDPGAPPTPRPRPHHRRPAPRVAYRPAEVAALLGVGTARVGRRVRAGRLAHVQLGGAVLVLAGDVDPTAPRGAARDVLEAWAAAAPPVLTQSEVASAVGVSMRTISRALDRGELPHDTDALGRRSIRARALARWLLARRIPPSWEATT